MGKKRNNQKSNEEVAEEVVSDEVTEEAASDVTGNEVDEEPKEEVKDAIRPLEDKIITVRAIGKQEGAVVGYSSNNQRIRVGDVFQIAESLFSTRWMERVPDGTKSGEKEEEGREPIAFSKARPVVV